MSSYIYIYIYIYMDLSHNGILAAGAKTLACALRGNCTITELNLASNGIGENSLYIYVFLCIHIRVYPTPTTGSSLRARTRLRLRSAEVAP